MNDEQTGAHAAALHRQAVVIDGHSDILVSICEGKVRLGQDFQLPDPDTWPLPIPGNPWPAGQPAFLKPHTLFFGSAGQYDLPKFQRGGITAQVCAIYLEDEHLDHALSRGLSMAWWLLHEAEENPGFELACSAADIRRLKQEGKVGGILSFEGLEPLGGNLQFLDLYHRLGLRMASLTHNRRNLFADGPQGRVKTGGLTELGRQAVTRMNDLGIVVDLVHMNETGFWEILELTRHPVVVSHTSAYSFARRRDEDPPHPGFDLVHDRPRLEALARNGAVLGVIFFDQPDLDKIVKDIETLLETIGPDHIGIGSDFYGAQFAPRGLENIAGVPNLTRALVARGHTDEVILKILGGNFLRVFEQVWGG